jgi:hypothetical protein
LHTAAIFLLDANYEVYVWLGWWPEEKNKLLKEANATTGSAHARWLRDKKLALQTAQNYIKGIIKIIVLIMKHSRQNMFEIIWTVRY